MWSNSLQLVLTALGKLEADYIIRGVSILDVHTLNWRRNYDIVIKDKWIAWVGPTGRWRGVAKKEFNASGYYAVPGFGDPHRHIESSGITPDYSACVDLTTGTTWIVEGSHEIDNVFGPKAADFWALVQAAQLPLKIFVLVGSAVPPTGFEITAGYHGFSQINYLLNKHPWIIGVDEVMEWSSVWNQRLPGHHRILEILEGAFERNILLEGHAAHMADLDEINAIASAGASSDHSVREAIEAWEKLSRGLFLELKPEYYGKVIPFLVSQEIKDWSCISLCTDDRRVEDMIKYGTMNYNIKAAIENGMPVEIAYAAASIYPARHFRIDRYVGSIAPGRYADIVLLRDPGNVEVDYVFANGNLVAQRGEFVTNLSFIKWPKWAISTLRVGRFLTLEDFAISSPHQGVEVVNAILFDDRRVRDELKVTTLPVVDGVVQRDLSRGITKIAVIDRYRGGVYIGKMFCDNIGPATEDSAIACSVAHDHHNIWVIGTTDEAMAFAVNRLLQIGGGYVFVVKGSVIAEVRLEVGGLMAARPAQTVADEFERFWSKLEEFPWFGKGVKQMKSFHFATLTCYPAAWVLIPPTPLCPSGFVNVRTGEQRPVVW